MATFTLVGSIGTNKVLIIENNVVERQFPVTKFEEEKKGVSFVIFAKTETFSQWKAV